PYATACAPSVWHASLSRVVKKKLRDLHQSPNRRDTNHMYSIHTAAEVEADDRTEMQRVLDAIFYRGAERPPMPLAEEREAIAAARAGDSQSFVALALSYAPMLRKAAEPYRAAESLWEDTVETVAVGLWQAIVDFKADKHDRLGAV